MTTTKYMTKNWSNTIKKVEIERETEKCIWIKDERLLKDGNFESVFDTFWEAAQHLISEQRTKVNTAEEGLAYQRTKMRALKDYIKDQKGT